MVKIIVCSSIPNSVLYNLLFSPNVLKYPRKGGNTNINIDTLLNNELPSKIEAKSFGNPYMILHWNRAMLKRRNKIAVLNAIVETPSTLYAESLPYKYPKIAL